MPNQVPPSSVLKDFPLSRPFGYFQMEGIGGVACNVERGATRVVESSVVCDQVGQACSRFPWSTMELPDS